MIFDDLERCSRISENIERYFNNVGQVFKLSSMRLTGSWPNRGADHAEVLFSDSIAIQPRTTTPAAPETGELRLFVEGGALKAVMSDDTVWVFQATQE